MKSTTLYIIGFVVLLGVLFSWNRIFPSKTATLISDPSALPGIQVSEAPWASESAHLAQRLKALGLPALSAEGTAMHIHQHLDIFIDGAPVAVPANIGINQGAQFISDIHTHDGRGVIHIEASKVQTFTLGQIYDIWGVRFTSQCIGSYCASGNKTIKVYSNGVLFSGDPRTLPLQSHQEIAVVFGAASGTPAVIPVSYTFGPNE